MPKRYCIGGALSLTERRARYAAKILRGTGISNTLIQSVWWFVGGRASAGMGTDLTAGRRIRLHGATMLEGHNTRHPLSCLTLNHAGIPRWNSGHLEFRTPTISNSRRHGFAVIWLYSANRDGGLCGMVHERFTLAPLF